MKLTHKVSLFFYLLLTCGLVQGQTAPSLREETVLGDTAIFRFAPQSQLFWTSYKGNNKVIDSFSRLIRKHRSSIESGNVLVRVLGFCSSFNTFQENLSAAKNRSNQVKSFFIVHEGLKEEHFRTTNSTRQWQEKVHVYSNGGNNTFFVNDLCSTIYNKTTGVTYNTIIEALQAAQSGEVILAGGLTCSDNLTIPTGVTLDGIGSSVFSGKLTAATNATLCNFTSEWAGSENRQAIFIQGSIVTLENLILTYKGSHNRSEAIVNETGTSGLTIKDCQFSGYWKGMYLNCSDNVTITGCIFDKANPFSTDKWSSTLSVKGNTIIGNIPTYNAVHFGITLNTEGMAGTTKYQESWPLALKESVYSVLTDNNYKEQNTPYMRLTYGINPDPTEWDYKNIYFCVTDFLKGNLANAQKYYALKLFYEYYHSSYNKHNQSLFYPNFLSR